MFYNFPELFLQSRELQAIQDVSLTFSMVCGFRFRKYCWSSIRTEERMWLWLYRSLSSMQEHTVKYHLLQYPIHITRPAGYYLLLQILCS